MSRRRTLWGHLRWDLFLITLLVVGFVGYQWIDDPRLRDADLPLSDGSRPPDRTEGDVLLLAPDAPAVEARRFENLDCSLGWQNALNHRFGSYASASSDALSPQLLAGHAVVVVPGRVASELSETARDHLMEFVEEGGQLIVELPRRGWERITGVSTIGQVSRARAITDLDGMGLHGPLREPFLDIPLAGQLLPVSELDPFPTGPRRISVDDQPGLITQSQGAGHVHSLLFDFGCSLTAMMQGRPDSELSFGPPDGDDHLPTADRVADDAMTATTEPRADLLQRLLFMSLDATRPVARLWPFPGDYRGAAMVIHPTTADPTPAFGFAEDLQGHDFFPTFLGAADHWGPEEMRRAQELDATLGLIWVQGHHRDPLTVDRGLGPITPWHQELTLAEQRSLMEHRLESDGRLTKVQSEGTLWYRDWDTTFRALAAAGMAIDLSFGPSSGDHYGFLFGTGMPFYPIDTRGRLLPVLTFPFVLDGTGLSPERLRALFEASDDAHHQPLAIQVQGDAMRHHPSADLMLALRDLPELADEHHHWSTTLRDYTDFLSARRQSVLTTQWDASQSRLTISVNLLGARLQTLEESASPGIAIPVSHGDAPLRRLSVDEQPVDVDALDTNGSATEYLLTLDPGRHIISAYYGDEDPDAG